METQENDIMTGHDECVMVTYPCIELIVYAHHALDGDMHFISRQARLLPLSLL